MRYRLQLIAITRVSHQRGCDWAISDVDDKERIDVEFLQAFRRGYLIDYNSHSESLFC